ncbi:hypothetical protein HDU91_001863 [Kappamyces sp. JEL0680]|nr:hypothetical protein HDU91_001863 [Kappamyces sp. JEL0680]
MAMALQSLSRSIWSPSLRRFYGRLSTIAILSLCVWVLSNIVIGALFYVLRLVFGERLFSALQANAMIAALSSALPNACMLVLRYIYPAPLDRLFYASALEMALDRPSHDKSQWVASVARTELAKLDYVEGKSGLWRRCCATNTRGGVHIRLLKYLKRLFNRAKILVICQLLSLTPVVGRFVWPIATLWYITRTFGFKPALVLVGISVLVPSAASFLTRKPLSFVTALRLLSRELLEPYLSRSNLSAKKQKEWLIQHQLVLSGFVTVFYPFLNYAFAGPLAFTCALHAMPAVWIEIVDLPR